jgi:predicted dehydrogenase
VDNYATSGTLTLFADVAGAPSIISPDVRVPAGQHQAVIAEFIEAVRSDDHAEHYGEFALHRSRIVDAIYQSILEGREVPIV